MSLLTTKTCRGADTEVCDINSCTPFLLAAANGHVRVVAKLEKRTQIDKLDKTRKSAVFLAAEGAHIPLLRVYCVVSYPDHSHILIVAHRTLKLKQWVGPG